MSRLARLFVLALLTVAFSGVSSVAAADQVSGSGTYGMGTDTVGFSISAEAGPAGEDPIGTLTVDFPGAAPVAAQVQCLSVP